MGASEVDRLVGARLQPCSKSLRAALPLCQRLAFRRRSCLPPPCQRGTASETSAPFRSLSFTRANRGPPASDLCSLGWASASGLARSAVKAPIPRTTPKSATCTPKELAFWFPSLSYNRKWGELMPQRANSAFQFRPLRTPFRAPLPPKPAQIAPKPAQIARWIASKSPGFPACRPALAARNSSPPLTILAVTHISLDDTLPLHHAPQSEAIKPTSAQNTPHPPGGGGPATATIHNRVRAARVNFPIACSS